MTRISQYLAIAVLLAGVVCVVIGSVFIAQAVEKNNWMKEAMQVEHVTLGIPDEQIAEGQVVDSLEEAQVAGDTRTLRHPVHPQASSNVVDAIVSNHGVDRSMKLDACDFRAAELPFRPDIEDVII